MKITKRQLARIIKEEIATVTDAAIEDVVMSILSDEGGAAGLEPIEDALEDLEDDEISLPDEPIEDVVGDVTGVKRHADGDFIDTTQLESKIRVTKSQLLQIIKEEKQKILKEQRAGAGADFETGSILVEFAQQYAALGSAIQEQLNEVIKVYLVDGGFPEELEDAIMQQNPAALERAVGQLRRTVSQMEDEGFEEAGDLMNLFEEIDTALRNM